jgi:hypothetical protein
MQDVADTKLEMESKSIARVHCSRCGEQIGRIQILPPEGKDPTVWDEEVQGEIELLADEHEPLCSKQRSAEG